MANYLRYHCDEHINPRVINGLKRYSIDVTSAIDADLLQQPDESHLAYAVRHKRVLVTHDSDFTVYEGGQHCGICYCHQSDMSIGQLIEYLRLFSTTTNPDLIAGRVEYMRPL